MGTVDDKLAYLDGTKTMIRNAVNVLPNGPYINETDAFSTYPSSIRAAGIGGMVAATDEAAWHILSPANMYTDRAGTTPVTALDDFVGYISDSSGNTNDFVAVSDAGRALYKTDGTDGWIQLDKVDDNYSTTFASPIVGTMLIGTRKGTIHLEVDIPAGAWSLTPNAAYFPGNTVTDIIIKDGYMTTAELANAKAWLASRGSPLVYTPTGTDLVSALRSHTTVKALYIDNVDASGITSLLNFMPNSGMVTLYGDFVNGSNSVSSAFQAFTNSPLTTISQTFLSGFPNITNLGLFFYNTDIIAIPDGFFDNQTSATAFNAVARQSLITSVQGDTFLYNTVATNFREAFYNTPVTTVGEGLFASQTVCTEYTNCFLLTNLTQTSIDNVLASIRASYAANGLTGGQFNQSGGSAPSAAGQADIDYLRAQGMTVTVTGGY